MCDGAGLCVYAWVQVVCIIYMLFSLCTERGGVTKPRYGFGGGLVLAASSGCFSTSCTLAGASFLSGKDHAGAGDLPLDLESWTSGFRGT